MASPWTVLLFGKSGSLKTSETRHIAHREYAKKGKTTRLVSADGGGWTPLQDYVDADIIAPWRVSIIEQPLSVFRKLSKGYWPKAVSVNGKRQLVLQEPTTDTWKQVGAYIIEGLTSISAVCMRDHLSHPDRRVSGENVVAKFEEQVMVQLADGKQVQDVEKYAFPAQGHYNSVQQSVYELVTAFSALPVDYVIFTALETAGEEKLTRKTQIGPMVIGQAMTTVAPAWFGDCIHLDTFSRPQLEDRTVDGKTQQVQTGIQTLVRAYFTTHPDLETGIPVSAKPRVPPSGYPALLEQFKGGFYTPTPGPEGHGLDLYLDAEEKLIGSSADSLRQWKQQVDAQRQSTQTTTQTKEAGR